MNFHDDKLTRNLNVTITTDSFRQIHTVVITESESGDVIHKEFDFDNFLDLSAWAGNEIENWAETNREELGDANV